MNIPLYDSSLANLWEGALEPIVPTRALHGLEVSVGTPFQWADEQLLGDMWRPPAGGNRFYLVQFAFSMRITGPGQPKVQAAAFKISFHSGEPKPIVFDAYPREQWHEKSTPVKLSLGPQLKMGVLEGSAGSLETTIDFGYVIPIVQTVGLQESSFEWQYTNHPRYPLTGSRQMLAIIALPKNMRNALLHMELSATLENSSKLIKLATPNSEKLHLRWVVGEK